MLFPPLLLVGSVTLSVTRQAAGSYVAGRFTPGSTSLVNVRANVQPVLKSTDTMLLPEADRSKAVLKVYTDGAELRQLKEGADGWGADRFTWEGEVYEVMKVISYNTGNQLKHFKALCSRVEQT